jgi:hypothetical protein
VLPIILLYRRKITACIFLGDYQFEEGEVDLSQRDAGVSRWQYGQMKPYLQRGLCHHANYQLFAIPTVNKSSIPISVGWTRDDGEIFKCHSDPRSNATFHSPDTASLTSGRPTGPLGAEAMLCLIGHSFGRSVAMAIPPFSRQPKTMEPPADSADASMQAPTFFANQFRPIMKL